MAHTLTVLFRRDASRDRHENNVAFEGYEMIWPDGRPVDVSLDAFCKHGQRLLGLGRHLQGRPERLLDLLCFPVAHREHDMTRLPGHRVRRFCLRRSGTQGRLHFLDGTPTAIVFDLERDEPKALEWVGLPQLADGEAIWIDVAARPSDATAPPQFPMTGQPVTYNARV